MEPQRDGPGWRKRRQLPPDRTADPELQRLYHRLLRPLSLFPGQGEPPGPGPEPLAAAPEAARGPGAGRDKQFLEQLSAASLCLLVAQRLAPVGQAPEVPPEGRRRLLEVILSELQYGWQAPPPEPGLGAREQQQLWQRVEAHVVLAAEQLFVRYLHLLLTLSGPQAVLTDRATLTRLSACLAADCSRFLTSPLVYRHLVSDFNDLRGLSALLKKGAAAARPDDLRKQALIPQQATGSFQASKLCPLPWPHSTGFAQIPCSSLNMSYLIHLSRPADFLIRPSLERLKGLQAIPDLDQRKYLRWLPTLTPRPPKPPRESQPREPRHPGLLSLDRDLEVGTFVRLHIPRRCRSLPCLREGWKLSDELGIPPLTPRTRTPLILIWDTGSKVFVGSASEDLKQMMKSYEVDQSRNPRQLSPLLGVMTRGPRSSYRLEKLQKTLKTLQEEEASGKWDCKPNLGTPVHPQPITVTVKLKDHTVLRAAAVRVSERALADNFFLKPENVLYNHLSGELNPQIVEDLDTILFTGTKIQEVYTELLSRVSADYLELDRGSLVEPTTDRDWSSLMSSGFLIKNPKDKIINPELDNIGRHRLDLDLFPPILSPQQLKNWDKNKTSWMRWWKTSVSPDDYLLYLTTQECDFLDVIFHTYPEEESEQNAVIEEAAQELTTLGSVLQEEDTRQFVPGIWDANSVLQGGLGGQGTKFLGDQKEVRQLQKRLEKIWTALQVPDKDRLDMAIKFSTNSRMGQLPALVTAWEKVLQPIQEREFLLSRLERFEQEASDPNRFFLKVDYDLWRWTEESQIRSNLYAKISKVETFLTRLLQDIQMTFGEVVTYKGRCYLDKMKRDKVEMLYWLQQERRAKKLVHAQKGSRLPSLNSQNTGNSEHGLTTSPRNV